MMEETRIDLRDPQQNDPAEGKRCAELCFKLSQTMPYTDEYESLVKELFCGNIGEGSRVMPGINVVRGNRVKIGKGVVIMYNCLIMAAGTITIEDDAQVAAIVGAGSVVTKDMEENTVVAEIQPKSSSELIDSVKKHSIHIISNYTLKYFRIFVKYSYK